MNITKLKHAEALFLQRYPTGFLHPGLAAVGKKHKMPQMIEQTQNCFAKKKFRHTQQIADNMVQMTARSSMVSMFEKPKFKEFVANLSTNEMVKFVEGFQAYLHGNQQKGFEVMLESLKPAKLAKWSLVTILPNYYSPNEEVFVKPTTAKGVIKYFELQNLDYKPLPSWDFYQRYRETILEMKSQVIDTLAPNNAAFCGFLMMSLNN